MNLGTRGPVTGLHDSTNPVLSGGWTCKFDPTLLRIPTAFEVYHIALKGPAGSTLQVYVDTVFYSNVARGDINDWDPSQTLPVMAGSTIYFYWNSAAAPAPIVTLWCREPSPL